MDYEPAEMERRLLEHVLRDSYQPVKPKVIVRQLKLDVEGKVALKRALKSLVRKGKLSYGSNHLVQRPTQQVSESQLVRGKFRKTMRGFGFVRPLTEDRPEGMLTDIYIPATRVRDAANDDLVSVKIIQRQRPGRDQPMGHIVEVLDRKTKQFVGTFVPKGGVGYVQVDGSQFDEPIYVGDVTAKQARKGDKVVVEMLRFPSERFEAEAVITEVLGKRHAVGVDTLTVIREFDLPEEFSDDVLEEARSQAASFDESVDSHRHDLSRETVITIDPDDARDFDDAISLRRLDNGHWSLGVHIADVSHFVRPNTSLDNEAFRRGNSVYLPDRVIPMLPELISNGLASLQPDHLRYTVTALIEFTADGARVNCEIINSAIKSVRRFTYEEVDDYLDRPQRWKDKLSADVFDLLGQMHELAMILRKRRFDNGALELFLPETKVDLDEDGKVVGAHFEVNTVSHQIIEEFMLAANVAVAEHLVDRELYLIRRIHEAPTQLKLKDLTEFVGALGIECSSLQSRFEIRRVIEHVQELPEKQAVNYAVLRAMQKAVYGPEEEGHYALNEDAYCHFTSPIRRYPDLIVHRMVKALHEGRRPAADFRHLTRLGEHCSDTEQRAAKAERELNKLKMLNFLSDKIGMEMDALVTGVEMYGLFAQGTHLPAEGLISLRSLPRDQYDYDATTRTLTARRSGETYRLGDTLRVRVAHVDLDRRELDLQLIRHLARPAKKVGRPSKQPAKGAEGDRSTASRTSASRSSGRKTGKKKGKTGGQKAGKRRGPAKHRGR